MESMRQLQSLLVMFIPKLRPQHHNIQIQRIIIGVHHSIPNLHGFWWNLQIWYGVLMHTNIEIQKWWIRFRLPCYIVITVMVRGTWRVTMKITTTREREGIVQTWYCLQCFSSIMSIDVFFTHWEWKRVVHLSIWPYFHQHFYFVLSMDCK